MSSRWGRLFVAFAAALAVWAIATPARAAAPLCDPRGATVLAPAPQLQMPETSIDVGSATDDCDVQVDALRGVEDGRAPAPSPPTVGVDPVIGNVSPAIVPASFVVAVDEDVTSGGRLGAHARVERPPRF